MRRVSIALLVCCVALALAVPAIAAVDCSNPKFANHPACTGSEEPPQVNNDSCYAHGEWGPDPVTEDFVVTLGGRDTPYPDGACIDVIAPAGTWKVTITTTGKVQSLNLFMRDSVGAGDGCFTAPDGSSSCGYMFRSNNIPTEIDFANMPGAWVNSCGTEWGEYVGSFWEGETFHQGGFHELADIDVESPLAFLPGIRAGSDAVVTLEVDIPPLETP